VWCEINVKLIIGIMFYAETVVPDVILLLTELVAHLAEEQRSYAWFQQDLATVHTTDDSLTALDGMLL
jgi:hypothetical protein